MPVPQRLDAIKRFLAQTLDIHDAPTSLLECLDSALTHDSFANEEATKGHAITDNERLEFLGDAAIGMAVTHFLYLHTDLREGDMTSFRQKFTNNRRLAELFRDGFAGLLPLVRVGEGQRSNINWRILAGCLEGVMGALYIHGGIDAVMDACCRTLLTPGSVSKAIDEIESKRETVTS